MTGVDAERKLRGKKFLGKKRREIDEGEKRLKVTGVKAKVTGGDWL